MSAGFALEPFEKRAKLRDGRIFREVGVCGVCLCGSLGRQRNEGWWLFRMAARRALVGLLECGAAAVGVAHEMECMGAALCASWKLGSSKRAAFYKRPLLSPGFWCAGNSCDGCGRDGRDGLQFRCLHAFSCA